MGGASGDIRGEPVFPALVGQVQEVLAGQSEIYLVGGAVRDAYRRRAVTDLDFVAAADGLDLAQRVAHAMRCAYYPLDAERRVGRVLVEAGGRRSTLDFASQRGHSLVEDLRARDFTLNAVAVPLSDLTSAVDPLGGLEDLRTSTLRACSPSALRDDPLRTLRAVRLAVQLDLHIDPDTREWIRLAASALPQVAAERVRDEFMRIMAGPKVAAALRVLQALGLLALVVPETAGLEQVSQPAPHVHDVWNHTLLLIDRLETLLGVLAPRADEEASADLILGLASLRLGRFRDMLQAHFERSLSGDRPVRGLVFLAALLHDVGKPETKRTEPEGGVHFIGHDRVGAEWAVRRAVQLHLSNVEAEYLGCIVRSHMRPQQLSHERVLTRRAIYRFYAATGECGVDVAVIALADFLGIYGLTLEQDAWAAMLDTVRSLLESYFEHRAEHIEPALFISGDEVMQALNLRPGPQIGALLEALREAQATGEVVSREAALEFVRALQSRA